MIWPPGRVAKGPSCSARWALLQAVPGWGAFGRRTEPGHMDAFTVIEETWLNALAWLAGLGAAFALLGWLMPCNRGMFWWTDRRALAGNVFFWFVAPLFLRVAKVVVL